MQLRWCSTFALFAAVAVGTQFAAPDTLAQAYPVKPIRIVVGFPAGSGADFVARMVGQGLSVFLGQPTVVENRTGAGGTIATGFVAAAPPDGYTLLQMTAAETAQPALRKKMAYNWKRTWRPSRSQRSAPSCWSCILRSPRAT